MDLKTIKSINQRIYELSDKITRENKVMFVSSLIFCLRRIKHFNDISRLTTFIDFTSTTNRPIDQLVDLSIKAVDELSLISKTKQCIKDSLSSIKGSNTTLDFNRVAFKDFISKFISTDYPSIKPGDLFFETLYMEIDKKANKSDDGIVLTPVFAANLMVELAEINYQKDVVADLCSGTGLFSLLSYSKMLDDINNDLNSKKITREKANLFKRRLYNSIIANDIDPKMVTICLANFLLKDLNNELLFNEDVLQIKRSDLKIKNNEQTIQPNKAILNPPYEDKFKPIDIILKNLELISGQGKYGKLVVIIPPQKFGQNKKTFSKILNIATLETVIKTQDDLFQDSGKSQSASIFVFDTSKPHEKSDIVHYYNFIDSGYIYLKDSGLVDKNGTYLAKKDYLLNKIKTASKNHIKRNINFIRNWSNFYEVNKELEIDTILDPILIKSNKEEADITLENIIIKKMLKEKDNLIKSVNNKYRDTDGIFEKYIIGILSEDQ